MRCALLETRVPPLHSSWHCFMQLSVLQAVLRPVAQPQGSAHVLFEHFWVETGAQPLPEPTDQPHFVMTASVRGHLRNLARAALVRRFPILLQARLIPLYLEALPLWVQNCEFALVSCSAPSAMSAWWLHRTACLHT